MKGYKVFNPDWTCQKFKYEVGKTYELQGEVILCFNGFHFCKNLASCFNYYTFDPKNKVAEIEAIGQIVTKKNKSATNKIKIVREMSWEEVLELVNTGVGNTGIGNTGNGNIGDNNTGYCNKGDRNTGDDNVGWRNTGDKNIGDCNTGYQNSGNCNTGNFNNGDDNTGYYNSGEGNTGSYNFGNWNAGDFNTSNHSTGCFNTVEQNIYMFNKPTDWTYHDWINSYACRLFRQLTSSSHTLLDFEKWWNKLDDEEKSIIKSLPNFDAEIFEEITGINVNKE